MYTACRTSRRCLVNRINRNFARLLLACKRGNIILQNGLVRQFHRIGLSIAHKKGWFHPDGPEGWLGVINLTLAKQLSRGAEWTPFTVFKHMKKNKFAYLYRAIQNGLVDELRRLIHSSREVTIPLDEEPFASLVAERINPDREIHRPQLLRLVDSALEDVIDNPPFEAILREVRDWVADPQLMPGDARAALGRRLSAY